MIALDGLNFTALSEFDTILDVRSPSEFAEDHMPNAISCPVLSDEERARVGTFYKQDSPFAARKIGAALVARNAAHHIETQLSHHDGAWRPLVYCWRGGQRSNSFATILRQIGWRAEVVEGGYRAYRKLVVARLYEQPLGLRIIRLDGNTGSAKTEILNRLDARGVQVLDLEGMARHRGSSLGQMAGAQPSQKAYETAIAARLSRFDPSWPVLVEAESARIGMLRIPPMLWVAMRDSPRIMLDSSPTARATYLAKAYADLTADQTEFSARLEHLRGLQSNERLDQWQDMIRQGAWPDLALELIKHHYDPAYARLRSTEAEGSQMMRITKDSLGAAEIAQIVDEIVAAL
ncbi:tRNA 2-selenouridine(34) synthase MnmH [Paracoccaceae bacterium]|nr:tRNA 2-selenouridine(34) synthase MnmH [Paracoccaceae bacterium]